MRAGPSVRLLPSSAQPPAIASVSSAALRMPTCVGLSPFLSLVLLAVEAPEHMSRPVLGHGVAAAVVHLDAVHPYAAHAYGVAQHARAATGQIVHAPQFGDADPPRLEQQNIGVVSGRDEPAPRDAVLARRIARQSP